MSGADFQQWAKDLLAASGQSYRLDGIADDKAPVARLLELVQGGGGLAAEDGGVAGLAAAQMEAVQANAALQATYCQERLRALLELLELGAQAGAQPRQEVLMLVSKQALLLLSEQQRWQALAENAAYYQDHPDVARRVAAQRAGQDGAGGGDGP